MVNNATNPINNVIDSNTNFLVNKMSDHLREANKILVEGAIKSTIEISVHVSAIENLLVSKNVISIKEINEEINKLKQNLKSIHSSLLNNSNNIE